ncbi:hypothetical protein [Pseudorhodoplanes sinuspersici]|nr:hypothetical protein [Pseudorhodoplanes sinuspersici]RKE71000.1 hypothetical protein DFP91_3252 [Pseudorhodoplanes sinuspersici]
MRLIQSLYATTMTLAALAATPVLALAQNGPLQVAQAAAPAGPPTSGWTTPGASQPAPRPPSAGWGAPGAASAPSTPLPGGWAPSGPQRDCGGEFMPLRQDAEKKAGAIKAAAATKKQPAVCAAFRNFAAAEAKVVKYAEDHGDECRIPADAIKMMKANHAKTIEIRTKVCDVAAAPQPRAPSLSDALGTSRIPTAPSDSTTPKRGGAFDTLTGNTLQR